MPKKFDKGPRAVARRKTVVKYLEAQLLTGFKNVRLENGEIGSTQLTELDRKRIQKELEILNSRV